jgi:hypothetical protein
MNQLPSQRGSKHSQCETLFPFGKLVFTLDAGSIPKNEPGMVLGTSRIRLGHFPLQTVKTANPPPPSHLLFLEGCHPRFTGLHHHGAAATCRDSIKKD